MFLFKTVLLRTTHNTGDSKVGIFINCQRKNGKVTRPHLIDEHY